VRFKNEKYIYHTSLTLQWTPFATCGFNVCMQKYAQCGPRLTQSPTFTISITVWVWWLSISSSLWLL